MKELYETLGIKGNPSTAYHPQTDGQTERVNQSVKEFLMMFVNDKQDDWSDWLAVAQFCHSDRRHSATTYSPFFLTYGYHPSKGLEPKREYTVEAVGDFVQRINDARETAKKALERSNELMKNQYDKHKKPAINYKPGDKVYINAEHLPSVRQSRKLERKFFGPYEVVEKVGQSAYRIKIPASWKVYNVFNESLLKPYYAPHYVNQKQKEKHTEDEQRRENDSGEYELERLLNSRISKRGRGRGRLEYLVKWKNYPLEEASWEPVTNLTNAQEAIEEFHLEYPDAPRRVRVIERTKKDTQLVAPKRLFGWQDGKFEPDDLERLEKAWERWKGKDFATVWDEDDDEEFVRTQTLKGG